MEGLYHLDDKAKDMPIHHLRVHRHERVRNSHHNAQNPHPEQRRNWKKHWKRLLFRGILLAGAGGALLAVAAFAWFSRELPDPNKILEREVAQSTRIYARDETTLLYEIHGDERRTVIPLEDIPKYMRDATVAIEDKNFYTHPGIDIRGVLRAIFVNTFTGSKTGGSTITQQFIKNAILTSEKTYTRKIKEAVLAFEIERKLSKDQILQLYLNEIPYGSTAYGVESAARYYFAKPANKLTLAESAVLAALPQAPTRYSPYGNNRELLIGRQKYILDQMVEQGYITRDEAEAAKTQELTFQSQREDIHAPHFVFYVRSLLVERFGEKQVDQGGLKVITTLDSAKQDAAERAVQAGREKVEKYGGTNAALVSLDAKTGDILAMVGSFDYFNDDIDGQVNVALATRQPGSSFKPLVYSTAFKVGYTPETMIFDLETKFSKTYTPKNYDGGQRGPLSFRQALAGSLNIPAVKVTYLIGLENLKDTTRAFHYSIPEESIDKCGLASALGCTEVTLLEHANAYATFAREGVYHPARAVLRVEDAAGKELLREGENPDGERVFEEDPMRKLNSVLSDARVRTFGQSVLGLPDRQLASKTGTTNEFVDAWAMGYTPSYATGVWVGRNKEPKQMKAGADGSVVAGPIYIAYMKEIHKGLPAETFRAPEPDKPDKPVLRGEIDVMTTVSVDSVTGKRIPDECLETYPAKYVTQKTFKETHTILHWVEKLKPRGTSPEHPENDPQYKEWESRVQAWARGHGYEPIPTTYEDCSFHAREADPTVTITYPEDGATMDEVTFDIRGEYSLAKDRKVKKVEYFIDTVSIGTVDKSPYRLDHTPTNLTNGNHTVTMKVFDDIGNFGSDTAPFVFKRSEEGTASVTLTEPKPNSTFTASDFPVTLEARVENPESVSSLKFYVRDMATEEDTLISTVSEDIEETVTTAWDTAAKNGSYRLFVKATTLTGGTTTSDFVKVTIEEKKE